MKTVRNLIFTILGGAFLCIVMASCDNFLTADEVRAQIEEVIEIANSSSVTMYLVADEDSGSVIPEQITKKKNQSFNVKFNPKPNWQFLNWEVIDRISGEVVPDAARFENPTSLETKGTLLKPDSNYQIHAKCIKQPVIELVNPPNLQSSNVDTPIYITFNMQMEASDVTPAKSVFKYGSENISIYCGIDNLQNCFDPPVFLDSEKKVLVITPKVSMLRDYINYSPYIDVIISFGQNIVAKMDQTEIPLSEEVNNSVTIRYVSQKENNSPVEIDNSFFVTRHPITLQTASEYFNKPDDCFNYDNIDYALSTDSDYGERCNKMLQNRTNGTIYIYGKYYDAESGVRAVTVKETLKYSPVSVTNVKDITHTYLSGMSGVEFVKDSGGNTFFCIECNLESGDGSVSVQVEVSDVAGNNAPVKSFVAIKKSVIDFSVGVSNGNYKTNYSMGGNIFNEDDFDSSLKEIILYGSSVTAAGFTNLYPIYNLPKQILEKYELRYEYVDKKGNLHNDKLDFDAESTFFGSWKFAFVNVDIVAGQEFKIFVKDDLGNEVEKQFKIPDSKSFICYKERKNPEDQYEYAYIVSSDPDYTAKIGLCIENYTNDLRCGNDYNSGNNYIFVGSSEIQDYISSYQFAPLFESIDGTGTRFFIEIPEDIIITYGNGVDNLDDVELKKDENGKPVIGFEKSTELYDNKPALKVTVSIADNSWDKYDIIVMQVEPNRHFMFKKGETSCSFLEKTSALLEGISPVKIKGYNNYQATNDTECPIPKIESDSDILLYDNIPPEVNEPVRKDWQTVTMSFRDEGSGPDYAIFKVKGLNKEFVADSENNYQVDIPILNVSDGYFYVDCWLYDKAKIPNFLGNYSVPVGYLPPIAKCWGSDNCWTYVSILYDEDISEMFKPTTYVEQYTYVDSDPDDNIPGAYQWIYLGNSSQRPVQQTWTNGQYYYQTEINNPDQWGYEHVSLPENSFVRVYINLYGCCSYPFYYYTGGESYAQGDVIVPSTNKAVLLSSTQPVYVYTVVTDAPYSECVNWTAEQWSYYHQSFGEEILDFKTYPTPFMQYDIQDWRIDRGYCYAVVAHFSSGKIAVSPVYQKE